MGSIEAMTLPLETGGPGGSSSGGEGDRTGLREKGSSVNLFNMESFHHGIVKYLNLILSYFTRFMANILVTYLIEVIHY